MKYHTVIIIISLSIFSCADNQGQLDNPVTKIKLNCVNDSLLSSIIPREAELLDNNSKLYWDFNCDSSWLTYESNSGIKKVLFSLPKELIELTTRLGHYEFQEFKNSFLYTHSVISGCCVPDEYYLYDKENGELIKQLGRTLYVGDKDYLPYFASLIYDVKDSVSGEGDYSVIVYNIDNGKQVIQAMPSNDVKMGMDNNHYLYPEDIFDGQTKIQNNILVLSYHIDKYEKGKTLKQKTIKFDLNKISN